MKIRRPDDFHVHLRDGDMLHAMAPLTAMHFARALVMPNLTPAILTAADVTPYRARIAAAAASRSFVPLMTVKIVDMTTPDMIRDARAAGVIAGKVYPVGVTTNSEDGVSDFEALWPVFDAMQAYGMVLCIHGESPGVFCMDRETHFVDSQLARLKRAFPALRVVLEHATTAAAVQAVRTLHNVAATITVHHLVLTLDDVIGDRLQPHHFCKPVAKTATDRAALLEAATSGHPRFFLGTDSAPHPRAAKECAAGCAGVFSAPVALAILAGIFEKAGRPENLERFTSRNGAEFYGLALNTGEIEIAREPWVVPAEYHGVVPFMAGRTLDWNVAS